jgi:hypothetical protein
LEAYRKGIRKGIVSKPSELWIEAGCWGLAFQGIYKKLIQNIKCKGCLRLKDSRGKKMMLKKLEMFVLVAGPIAFAPFYQMDKDSCRVHHSYLVAMLIFPSI